MTSRIYLLRGLFCWIFALVLQSGLRADMPGLNPQPRALSMGGAGLAAEGTYESASMNPAGLNDISKSKFHILPILVEVPFEVAEYYGFYDQLKEVDDQPTEEAKREKFKEFLSDVSSLASAARVNLYPSWTTRNLHIGLLADFLVNPRFRIGGTTSNQLAELGGSNGTAGLIAGGAYSFYENRIQVGVTLKGLYRAALTQENQQTVYDILKNQDEISDAIFGESKLDRKGFGFGGDLGVKYWIPWQEDSLKPAVGVTYQDIGDTRFIGSDGPPSIGQSLSAGAAIHPQWKFLKNKIAIDFRNLNEKQEFLNMLHLGAESILWDLLALRVGLAQGYIGGGFGFITRIFEFDAFVSAREVGRKARIQEERTIGLRLALGF